MVIEKMASGVFKAWLAVALCLIAATNLYAQSGSASAGAQSGQIDPSEIFFRAYLLMKDAEEQEALGEHLMAFNKYREAQHLFDAIARSHPNYNPSVIKWRQKYVREKAAMMNQLQQQQPPASGAPNLAGQPSAPMTPGMVPPNQVFDTGRSEIRDTGQGAGDGQLQLPTWSSEQRRMATGQVPSSPATGPVTSPDPYGGPGVVGPGQAGGLTVDDATQRIRREFEEMRQKIALLTDQNSQLQQAIRQKDNELSDMRQRQQQAELRQQQLEQSYAELMAQESNSDSAQQQIAALKTELANAINQVKEVTEQNRMLVEELDRNRQELALLEEQKQKILAEKEKLNAVVAGSGGKNAEMIVELTQANDALRAELETAQKEAEKLSQESGKKDQEIGRLTARIQSIDNERNRLLKENEEYETRIASLTGELKRLSQGLVDEASLAQALSPEVRAENQVLRNIVIRQLTRQAQAKQARELLLGELDKIGADTTHLIAYVDQMSQSVAMSPEEKNLFRNSEIQDSLNPAEVNVTIVAEGSPSPETGNEESIIEIEKLSDRLSRLQKAAQLDFSTGNYAEAEEGYRQFLRLKPDSVECLCNLAVIKIRTHKLGEAEELLEQAVSIRNNYGQAYYLLGVIYLSQNKMDDALTNLDESLKYDPENAKAHNHVGYIASQKGMAEKAETSFQEAIRIQPNFAEAHFNLSVFYATREEPSRELAEKHYMTAVQLGAARDAAMENFLGG